MFDFMLQDISILIHLFYVFVDKIFFQLLHSPNKKLVFVTINLE